MRVFSALLIVLGCLAVGFLASGFVGALTAPAIVNDQGDEFVVGLYRMGFGMVSGSALGVVVAAFIIRRMRYSVHEFLPSIIFEHIPMRIVLAVLIVLGCLVAGTFAGCFVGFIGGSLIPTSLLAPTDDRFATGALVGIVVGAILGIVAAVHFIRQMR